MSELLLVNPRRRKAGVKRKRRTRRAMSALQRQYFGKRRSTKRRSRRRSLQVVSANPAPVRHRRRRSGGKRRSVARRAHSRVQRLRGFNINSFMRDTLVPCGIGAAGALAADVALGYATPYLPSFLTTGIGAPIAKIGAAIGIGMVAGMATNRRMGEQVMAGAVTVVLYSYLKKQVQAALPNLTMSGMGYSGPAYAFPDRRMGMYVADQQPIPPAVVAAIAANATKGAPAAQTVGEYVSGYEREYQY